ncbi:MAG TPA: PAS domain-containing sensor histidine kinase [Candidatus Saccharimonadales bacterium]
MAVKLNEFYGRFRLKTLAIAFGLQLIVGGLLIAWSILAAQFGITPTDYLLNFVGPFILLELMAIVITTVVATEPTRLFTDALSHATNQAGNTAPLEFNETKYSKNGLKDIISSIYKLAAKQPLHLKKSANYGQLYQRVFEQSPFGIIVLDGNRQIIQANSHAPLRENASDIRGLALIFDQSDPLISWIETCEEREINAERMWTRVAERTEGGERRLFDVLASYHKDAPDGAETVIATIDRTREYAPDEEHMEFIALAAHELRGPITVIRGYLDVFADELAGKLDGDQQALMDRLSVSANRLSGYINNILGAARYDHQHLKLHLYEHRAEDLYQAVSQDLALRAHTQNRILSINLPSDLPTIAADKNSIGEVIVNLVDNAIKYSNEGGQVILGAKVVGDFVEFSVQDFGIGIPSPVIQKLFTKFYRSHRSRETAAGSGLGLYIAKAIVESHGGNISVRSTEGHGSTFSFTLPVYKTVAEKLRASNNSNESIIESSNNGWIRNHAMYRG